MQLEKLPNTSVSINGKVHLYFSGTSYLGINALPEFREILSESIKKWGISYGSSRNANLKLSIYRKGEDFISSFLKTKDAVTVSSGTLAGHFALRALKKSVDTFYHMPKTHPAILTEKSTAVFNNSFINEHLKKAKNKTICILADTIAALETKPFSFDFLKEISNSNKIYVLLDESHSLGVLGEKGNGISSSIPNFKNIEVIIVSSLGKAFGINGGLIAGSTNFINLIKDDFLFVGSAGMSPSLLDVFMKGQKIYNLQRQTLKENIAFVYLKVSHYKGITISKKYPVFFVDDENIANFLLSKNIVITSFYYPTSLKKMNRIVINANHTKEHLDYLCSCLIAFFK